MVFIKGHIPWNKGLHLNLNPNGGFKKGSIPWNKGTKGIMPKIKPESFKIYRKKSWTGENNPNWKGGSSEKEKIIKNSSIWRKWRKLVFERDNFTCQICGEKGGRLHPDHIKPFSEYPKLRFDINNGRTLCIKCHRLTPTYGLRLIRQRKPNESG